MVQQHPPLYDETNYYKISPRWYARLTYDQEDMGLILANVVPLP